MRADLFLEYPHIAKHRLRSSLRIAAYQETDQAGRVSRIRISCYHELAIDVEAELGAAGDN